MRALPYAVILAAVALACSPNARQRPRQGPDDDPATVTTNAQVDDTCTSDADCVASPYFDPGAAGSCCPAIAGPTCVAEVVTTAEANRRRAAWEAQCSAVRCAPSASCATGIWTPAPACRDGACVDTARPD